MLGEGQWQTLEGWLLAVKDVPVKFLVSSCSMLFRMWADIPRDRWVGFPEERDRLLSFLAANDIRDLYLLSGDLHSAHAVRAELFGPHERALDVWEFCASPFEQDPNWLAKWTRAPLRNGILKQQELKFIYDQNNFGLVRVFYKGESPRVVFELYDEDGQLLDQTGKS